MKNRLISASLTVLIFWWAVLTVIHLKNVTVEAVSSAIPVQVQQGVDAYGNPIMVTVQKDASESEDEEDRPGWFARFVKSITMATLGIVWGALLVLAYIWYRRVMSSVWLAPSSKRGVSITLGPFPAAPIPPARIKRIDNKPPMLDPVLSGWIESHLESHPKHVALVNAMIDTYLAHTEWPASHEGSHGDTPLFVHVQNVARHMLRRARDGFLFEGVRGQSGVLIPLDDTHFKFDMDDPLLPIVGLAHDLGKITCFEKVESGAWAVVSGDHAQESAKLLQRFDEAFALPADDLSVLLNVVSNYHNPKGGKTQMTLNAGDRARAFVELLNLADTDAAKEERRRSDTEAYGFLAATVKEVSVSGDLVSGVNGYILTEHEQRVFGAFEMIIQESKRINGSAKDLRIGFKYDNLAYLQERALWEVLAKKVLGDPMLDTVAGRNQHALTVVLQRALYKKGLLYHKHAGREFSYKNAVFKTRFVDIETGKDLTVWPCTLVVNISDYPAVFSLSNAKSPPLEMHPYFGWNSAINVRKPIEKTIDIDGMGQEEVARLAEGESARILKETREAVKAISDDLSQISALSDDPFIPTKTADDDLDVPIDRLLPENIPDFTSAQIGQLVLGQVLGRDGRLGSAPPGYTPPPVAFEKEAAPDTAPTSGNGATSTPGVILPAEPVILESVLDDGGLGALDDHKRKLRLSERALSQSVSVDALDALSQFVDPQPKQGLVKPPVALPVPPVAAPPGKIVIDVPARVADEKEQRTAPSGNRGASKPGKVSQKPIDVSQALSDLATAVEMGVIPVKKFSDETGKYRVFPLAVLNESVLSSVDWHRVATALEKSPRQGVVIREGATSGRSILISLS